jgi:hypothetical protein
MRTLLWIYLIGYFALVLAAALVLWRVGILSHVPVIWLALASLMAVGPGIVLMMVSRGPVTDERE